MTLYGLALGFFLLTSAVLTWSLYVMRKDVQRMRRDVISALITADNAKAEAIANLVKSAWLLEQSERIKNASAVEVQSWTVN